MSKDQESYKVCEVCGQKAVIAIRDIRDMRFKTNPEDDRPPKRMPIGKPHYFCEIHKREPKIIEVE